MQRQDKEDVTMGGLLPAVAAGCRRTFKQCRKCKRVAYYDYVPFSLSNPITTMPCGHGAAEHHMGAVTISVAKAAKYFVQQRGKEQAVKHKVPKPPKPGDDAGERTYDDMEVVAWQDGWRIGYLTALAKKGAKR